MEDGLLIVPRSEVSLEVRQGYQQAIIAEGRLRSERYRAEHGPVDGRRGILGGAAILSNVQHQALQHQVTDLIDRNEELA